jgi:transposase-like protein
MEDTNCPQCGSKAVVPIVYGLPGERLMARLAAGEVRLGGCGVGPRDPEFHCKACGNDWRVSEPGYPRRRPL